LRGDSGGCAFLIFSGKSGKTVKHPFIAKRHLSKGGNYMMLSHNNEGRNPGLPLRIRNIEILGDNKYLIDYKL
jgi:hypothetical protein